MRRFLRESKPYYDPDYDGDEFVHTIDEAIELFEEVEYDWDQKLKRTSSGGYVIIEGDMYEEYDHDANVFANDNEFIGYINDLIADESLNKSMIEE